MRALGSMARRLATAAVLALALTAAAGVVDNPARDFARPVTLPDGAPDSGVGGAARPGSGFAGAVLGVIGYKPAVLARLDPRTLRPLPGPRVRLRYGISGYGWSPDRSLLVLGDIDDDALHVVDPVRLRLATIRFGIVAEAPQAFEWLGPRRPAVVAADSGDGSTLLMVDPQGGRAFVVAAGAPVAEVELASLRVTSRHLRQPASLLRRLAHWLVPPAEAKLAAGTLNGDLVYAAVDTDDEDYGRRIVSLRSGRVLSSSEAPLPVLLLGERGPTC